MDKIEGTYTCVKTQSFVDFLISLGVESSLAKKMLGTHWSMRIWKDEELWGGSFMCREYPQFNTLDTMMEGVEKAVSHYMFGGKSKLVFKKNGSGDGFSTTCDSVSFGKLTWESKYFEEGAHFTFSGKGKSMTETWDRLSRTEGSYIFDHGENHESYFKAVGEGSILEYIDTYKIHMLKKGPKTIYMSERFGDLGKYSNLIELDVECPFYCLGDKNDEPSCKVTLSKTGCGKYTKICKSKDGIVEELKFSFNDWGLTMTCSEKKSGQTCKLFMRRFRDTSGTFKLVSMTGFEKFGKAMGVSSESIDTIVSDHTTRLVIVDKGDGYIRHQLIRKKHPMDYCFRLNEQFSLYHPLLKEVVRAVATVNRYTFCMVSKTSRGPLKSVMHFNDNFITWSITLPESHLTCKMVFERLHHGHRDPHVQSHGHNDHHGHHEHHDFFDSHDAHTHGHHDHYGHQLLHGHAVLHSHHSHH